MPCDASARLRGRGGSAWGVAGEGVGADAEVEDGHADGEAVGDLLEDGGVGPSATSVVISRPRFMGPG